MNYKIEEQYKRARRFLDGIDGKVSIIFHSDGDGVTSAVQIAKYLKEENEVMLAEPNDKSGIYMTEGLIERAKSADKIVFVDLALDDTEVPEKIDDKEVLVIDHHTPTKDLNDKENFTHINPRFHDKEVYLPAAYLCYKILDREEFLWIAGIGVVSDYGVENCQDLMKDLGEKYPKLLEGELTQKDVQESKIGLYSKMINSARGVKGKEGLMEAYGVLLNSEKHEDLMSGRLLRYHEKFQGELERLIVDFNENATYYSKSDAYIYGIDSKYALSSTLSTVISGRKHGSIVFITRESNGLKINVRCQTDRVDVGKLVKKLVKDIGKGGGHPNAAGGKIPRENTKLFMNRLEENLDMKTFDRD